MKREMHPAFSAYPANNVGAAGQVPVLKPCRLKNPFRLIPIYVSFSEEGHEEVAERKPMLSVALCQFTRHDQNLIVEIDMTPLEFGGFTKAHSG